jgi:hypothetical protein
MMAWLGNSHLLLVEEVPCLPFYSSCLEAGYAIAASSDVLVRSECRISGSSHNVGRLAS